MNSLGKVLESSLSKAFSEEAWLESANLHWNHGRVELAIEIVKFSILNIPDGLDSIVLLLKFHDRSGQLNRLLN